MDKVDRSRRAAGWDRERRVGARETGMGRDDDDDDDDDACCLRARWACEGNTTRVAMIVRVGYRARIDDARDEASRDARRGRDERAKCSND